MRALSVVAFVFTFTSATEPFTPKSGDELKDAVDACTNTSDIDTSDIYALDLPIVDIDTGRFKYLLIKVTTPAGNTFNIVRGHNGVHYTYHSEVAAPTITKLNNRGWKHEILGGGTISHSPEAKTIFIYGARTFKQMCMVRFKLVCECCEHSNIIN